MLATHRMDERLTQVMIEKKEKATMARAASGATAASGSLVLDHWLARTQKQMNHRNVQAATPE